MGPDMGPDMLPLSLEGPIRHVRSCPWNI